jgi:hypothetical protein
MAAPPSLPGAANLTVAVVPATLPTTAVGAPGGTGATVLDEGGTVAVVGDAGTEVVGSSVEGDNSAVVGAAESGGGDGAVVVGSSDDVVSMTVDVGSVVGVAGSTDDAVSTPTPPLSSNNPTARVPPPPIEIANPNASARTTRVPAMT